MIWTVLFAIVFFSLIIFVHELGHFLCARWFGVRVHEFAIGMGPKIFTKIKDETVYSLRAIPIGGFCSMEGEDQKSQDAGSFSAKAWYKKLIILAAGAVMNILLGFIITTVLVSVSSAKTGIATVTVDSVLEVSPLRDVLKPGDKILKLNGKSVHIKKDIDFIMQQSSGEECKIEFLRNGEKIKADFLPYTAAFSDGTPAYIMGINVMLQKPTVLSVLHQSYYQTVWMGKLVFVSFGMLFKGQTKISEISGPVGVVGAMNSQAQNGGFLALLYLAGFISVNIGIVNLLPIPALDGGRIFFVLVEAIRRKPIPPEKEGVVHFIGLVFLMAVMVFATWNDIIRLFVNK